MEKKHEVYVRAINLLEKRFTGDRVPWNRIKNMYEIVDECFLMAEYAIEKRDKK